LNSEKIWANGSVFWPGSRRNYANFVGPKAEFNRADFIRLLGRSKAVPEKSEKCIDIIPVLRPNHGVKNKTNLAKRKAGI
jgi:hypothetical protein